MTQKVSEQNDDLKSFAKVYRKKASLAANSLQNNYDDFFTANESQFEYYSFEGSKPLIFILEWVFGKRAKFELGSYVPRITSSILETCIWADVVTTNEKGVTLYTEGVLPILLRFMFDKHADKPCVYKLKKAFVKVDLV